MDSKSFPITITKANANTTRPQNHQSDTRVLVHLTASIQGRGGTGKRQLCVSHRQQHIRGLEQKSTPCTTGFGKDAGLISARGWTAYMGPINCFYILFYVTCF
ncbi:hypothetical protein H1C71_005495 [Ictidomys tridecemlineatus]|nr:hypothetical protein H1C71_005495 [Ictidomys tridecemlineatus]